MAALLSKTVTVSLPAVLLVILWWKRGRITRRDVVLLIPFFAIGMALALVTVTMEKNTVGAEGAAWDLSVVQRFLVAGHALWFYAGKLIWPVGLNFFYPRWDNNVHDPWQYLYTAAAVAVIVGLWFARRVGGVVRWLPYWFLLGCWCRRSASLMSIRFAIRSWPTTFNITPAWRYCAGDRGSHTGLAKHRK